VGVRKTIKQDQDVKGRITSPSKCIWRIPFAAHAFYLNASCYRSSSKYFVAVDHVSIISLGTSALVRCCKMYRPGGSRGLGGSMHMVLSGKARLASFLAASSALSLLLVGSNFVLGSCCCCFCFGGEQLPS
jgi:hypothetical protein